MSNIQTHSDIPSMLKSEYSYKSNCTNTTTIIKEMPPSLTENLQFKAARAGPQQSVRVVQEIIRSRERIRTSQRRADCVEDDGGEAKGHCTGIRGRTAIEHPTERGRIGKCCNSSSFHVDGHIAFSFNYTQCRIVN